MDILLDTGLSEFDFWNMTLAELDRYANSFKRREKRRLQEKTLLYYRLADLIGVSIGRYYDKRFTFPEIYEVFSGIYTEEEVETSRQEERDKRSIERLMRFINMNKEKEE